MSFRVVIQGLADGGARRRPARPPPRWGPEGVERQGDGAGLGGEGVGITCWKWPPCPLQPSRCSIPCVPAEAGERAPGPCGSVPAQKRWQHCSWWRSSPGRTQRPGRSSQMVPGQPRSTRLTKGTSQERALPAAAPEPSRETCHAHLLGLPQPPRRGYVLFPPVGHKLFWKPEIIKIDIQIQSFSK